MTLHEIDRQEFVSVMGEAMEKVIMPHIVELKDDVSSLKENVSSLKDDVSTLKDDVKKIHATLDDHGDRLVRMENKLDATIKVNDRHDRRLTRVEKHLGLPALEPAA